MTDWTYGGHAAKYHMERAIPLPNDSMVKVADWMIEMPTFMHRADTLFVDPPWNMGNVKAFYTKAGIQHPAWMDEPFTDFLDKLFDRIASIGPHTVFMEMGKEYLAYCLTVLQQRYPFVTFYNATYYRQSKNKCYVIHASNKVKKRLVVLEDMDEEAIIEWVCTHYPYGVIGDLCMGTGLVGWYAHKAGRSFVGTELNENRLAILVDAIVQNKRGLKR